jgi:hypothetical protein
MTMDRLAVLLMFAWQYLLMAFLCCLGIVQLAAARSGRRRLWLAKRRCMTTVAGAGLLIGGMAFFYLIPLVVAGPSDPVTGTASWARATLETLAGARNINDTAGGLSGHWQALWFCTGWTGAVFFARGVGRLRRAPDRKLRLRDQETRILVGSGSEHSS